MNNSEYHLRYHKLWAIQYRGLDIVSTKWHYRDVFTREDQARRAFDAVCLDPRPGIYRLVVCGPPQYDYIVREVLLYREFT